MNCAEGRRKRGPYYSFCNKKVHRTCSLLSHGLSQDTRKGVEINRKVYLAISYGRLHADTYPLAGGHLTLNREEIHVYAPRLC